MKKQEEEREKNSSEQRLVFVSEAIILNTIFEMIEFKCRRRRCEWLWWIVLCDHFKWFLYSKEERVRQPCVHFDWFLCHYTLKPTWIHTNINIKNDNLLCVFSFEKRIKRKLNKIIPFEMFGLFSIVKIISFILKIDRHSYIKCVNVHVLWRNNKNASRLNESRSRIISLFDDRVS